MEFPTGSTQGGPSECVCLFVWGRLAHMSVTTLCAAVNPREPSPSGGQWPVPGHLLGLRSLKAHIGGGGCGRPQQNKHPFIEESIIFPKLL